LTHQSSARFRPLALKTRSLQNRLIVLYVLPNHECLHALAERILVISERSSALAPVPGTEPLDIRIESMPASALDSTVHP